MGSRVTVLINNGQRKCGTKNRVKSQFWQVREAETTAKALQTLVCGC